MSPFIVNQIDLQGNPQFPSKFFTDIFYQSVKLESPAFAQHKVSLP